MSRIQTQKSTDAQNNHIKERSQEGKGTGEEMTRKMRKKKDVGVRWGEGKAEIIMKG